MSAIERGRLIDPHLFVDEDASALAGSSCADCGAVTFPAQVSCPRCTSQRVERTPLPSGGVLWAFTVQRFPPKSPYLGAGLASFEPYVVGYVDLGDVLVESRLVGADPDTLAIGDAVEFVLERLDGPGDEAVWTYAFHPVMKAQP